MAPRYHAAIRFAADHTTVVVEHIVVSALVEITTAALHLPAVLRLLLTLTCLVRHWQFHLRRHT